MSINVECMKHFTISKKENDENYELIIDPVDVISTEWKIVCMNDISKFLKENIPNEEDVLMLLPTYLGLSSYDNMYPEDKVFFSNLSSPETCLSILKKYDLIEKSKIIHPSITPHLEWLKNYWMQGYTIVFNGSKRAITV